MTIFANFFIERVTTKVIAMAYIIAPCKLVLDSSQFKLKRLIWGHYPLIRCQNG